MIARIATASLVATAITSAAFAQGPIERAGRALDNAGRAIRYNVESAVARGNVSTQERQLINHVSQRLNLDRRLVGSALQIVVEPGGAVALAAALAGKLPVRGRTVGVVVSGGNVDAELFAEVLTAA